MKRILFWLFLRPLLFASGLIVFVLLAWHMRLGDESPGLLSLAKWGMKYYIPLLFIVVFIVPAIFGLWRLAQFRSEAKTRGLALTTYLDLLDEDKRARRSLDDAK